jgi:hypothetical protein
MMTPHRIALLFLLLFSMRAGAQEALPLEAFRYVVLETLVYEDQQIDKYLIGSNLRRLFYANGYYAVSDQKTSWPDELLQEPCRAVYGDIETGEPMFGRYRVQLVMRDCLNRTLARFEGRGSGEDSREAYARAVEQALRDLPVCLTRSEAVEAFSAQAHASPEIEGRYAVSLGGKNATVLLSRIGENELNINLLSLGDSIYDGTVRIAELSRSALGPDLYQTRLQLPGEPAYDTFAQFEGGEVLSVELRGGRSEKLVFKKMD